MLENILPHVTAGDFAIIAVLAFLEGILSIDNALVLAMLARKLPKEQQKKALTYGLIGAVVFRLAALGVVTYLIQWRWVKWVGGGYLIFIALKHMFASPKDEQAENLEKKVPVGFWSTVLVIELTDIAFAVDSILAAVALSPKYWVVFTGGIMGVVMMRYAANMMIHLLEKFPHLEKTAYQLVLLIGVKVTLEGVAPEMFDFHSAKSPYTWGFWLLMAGLIVRGFIPKSSKAAPPA